MLRRVLAIAVVGVPLVVALAPGASASCAPGSICPPCFAGSTPPTDEGVRGVVDWATVICV